MNSEKSVVQEAKEAVTDNSESIDEKVPGTPFAIVAMSYLAILAIGAIILAFIFWLT